MRPIFGKTLTQGLWMPAAVLFLGSLSICLLIWTGRINEKQRMDYVVNAALMDVQIHSSVFHLWLEEYIGGNPDVEMKSIWKEFETAVSLTEAVLNGGKTEHGVLVEPFKDPGMRAQAEGIKASLVEMKEVALERLEEPEKSGIISDLNQRFDKVFGEVLARASALDRIVEAERLRSQENARHLFYGILSVWTLIVIVAVLGLWSREFRRKMAEEEIKRLNCELAARAAELEAANRELEAFNYTVAHDLRKPLTVVNGYCQALKELCGVQLDVHCKEYLKEAYEGTLRMNRLIDALLRFSRMAHIEPQREVVDLSVLAQAVAAELELAEPERRVTFRIAEGMSVNGDPNLLHVALDNLLGNAWKFTATKEEAVVEFGMTEIGGKPVCFVRDNGAGFDMADAGKLFTPFQRLPGGEEFKGHGIGLATVERIISRHGGMVWAEGKPGKGATFYFTLSGGRTVC
jgi:signal transduction histidine kinase